MDRQDGERASIAILLCGALAREIIDIVRKHGWRVDIYALPAILHNRPERIAPAVDERLRDLTTRYHKVVVAYGDCGTGGALDAVLARYPNARRLQGPHCYEMYGGDAYDRQATERPGTFFLTDFLARGFTGMVWKGLGLDRHPELRDDYFANYTDVVWLAQNRDQRTEAHARKAAERLKLPLTVVETGYGQLEKRLQYLVEEWRVSGESKGEELNSTALEHPHPPH